MRSRYRRFEPVLLTVTVVVGRTRLSLQKLSELEPGQVLPLDRALGTPFELVAREQWLGEVEPVASEVGIALKLVASAKEEQPKNDPAD